MTQNSRCERASPTAGGIVAVVLIFVAAGLFAMRSRLEAWFGRGTEGTGGRFEMQTSALLPFQECAAKDLPAARTPSGAPLDLTMVEGSYVFAFGPGGAGLKIRGEGWDLTWCGCVPPGSESHGRVWVEDGRLVFESNTPSGTPSGKKCAAIPVWWDDRVFLLSKKKAGDDDEISAFLNNLNWGGAELMKRGESWYFSRSGVRDRSTGKPPASGLVLPKELEARVLKSSWSGQLLSKTEQGFWKIAFGKKQGAWVGQRILTKVHSEESGYLDVVSVEEDTCLLKPAEYQKSEGFQEGLEVWADARGAEALKNPK